MAYKVSLILAVGLALIYAFQGFYPESIGPLSNILSPLFAGLAVISAGLALRKYGQNLKERFSIVWLCFTVGMVLWFLGEAIWAIYTLVLNVEIPYPSVTDVFWLVGYVPLFLGLFLYVKTFASVLSRRMLSTVIIVVLVSSALVTAPLIASIGTEEDTVTMIANFAYPLLDLLLLAASLLGIVIFSKGNLGKSWLLINGGILATMVGDVAFSYASMQGTYYNGHPIDLIYNWGYLLLFLAFYVHTKEL